ncbi:MAG: signal peptidase I [Thermodesulfobacteriota bacterium]
MASTTLNNQTQNRDSKVRNKSFFREYGEALFIALILALVIRAFVVQAFSIPSGSMIPTLLVGDYLLVNKFSYGIRNPFTNKVLIPTWQPQRGEVAVFIFPQDPSKDYIKRIIGLPGDRVQVINKKVYINGELYVTPQAQYADNRVISPNQSTRDNFGPVVVPKNAYFFMGDNRDKSYDSRFWGFVPMSDLRGRAFIIYFSWKGDHNQPFYVALLEGAKGLITKHAWDTSKFQVRWDRIGKIIH